MYISRLYYRYTCTHRDFVRSLSWREAGFLYTCGWDSQVLHHDISNLSVSTSTAMEVNGESIRNESMDYAKTVKKMLNGNTGSETPKPGSDVILT